jgi:thymidylate synthase (FAD)
LKVTLTHYPANPIQQIEEAACNCYDSKPTDGKIAKSCYTSGHTSVFEFADFTFHIEGVSRTLMAELTRHRMSNFAIRSQRYVDESNAEWVVPPSIQNNQTAKDIFNVANDTVANAYSALLALGIPKEDARFVLPNACPTVIEVKMNARALMNFMNLRLCNRAQWEIRNLANKMKLEIHKVCPELDYAMVPKCEAIPGYPFCTERNSCGKHPKIKEVYKTNGNDR